MLYLLPGSGGTQSPMISLPARAVSWYLLMVLHVVAAVFLAQAAEGGTCASGRESWTGF